MNLSKWINLIKEDLKEEPKVLTYCLDNEVLVFLEEIIKETGVGIRVATREEELIKIAREDTFQVIIIMNLERSDKLFLIIRELRQCCPMSKIAIILNYLKGEDIGYYFEEGADEVIFTPFTLIEFKARLNKLFKEYYLDKKLQRTAVEDPLTGVYNRRYFEEALQEEVYKALRQGYSLCLMMIDIDNFKWYNDNFGHQAGDEILKKLGNMLKKNIRNKIDKVCRYGGDEFVIILPHTSWQEAVIVANRICNAWNTQEVKPTSLSIGIAQLINRGDPQTSLSDLINRADMAMYQTKQETKDVIKNSWKVDAESIIYFSDEEPLGEDLLFQS
ncbi:MAG: GGDEF domain-containing response regulator [Thermodesulfobacteria bacterium]|nr:GGDEF domain-containing response regulator [Thermodesulfobacteriota bacterium]